MGTCVPIDLAHGHVLCWHAVLFRPGCPCKPRCSGYRVLVVFHFANALDCPGCTVPRTGTCCIEVTHRGRVRTRSPIKDVPPLLRIAPAGFGLSMGGKQPNGDLCYGSPGMWGYSVGTLYGIVPDVCATTAHSVSTQRRVVGTHKTTFQGHAPSLPRNNLPEWDSHS